MLLTIEGISYTLTPLKDFRALHDLPPDFGMAFFEHKDYIGLGRIDRAGGELNRVRAAVLAALPERMQVRNWLDFLPSLTGVFQSQLEAINPQVGLKAVEIEYAVAGFSDVCRAFAYALLRAQTSRSETPGFQSVYHDWLNQSAHLFSEIHPLTLRDQTWHIQIIAHAYGRIGLRIQTPDGVNAVYDPSLACPAEGFMTSLLHEVAGRMQTASIP